jgi:tellurium resistance protein TerD
MAVQLSKGGNVNLLKEEPGLEEIIIGLGWDPRETAGAQFDADASLFMLRATGKVPDDKHFIFYNEKVSPCGSVTHQGDNRDGAGEGDDEQIVVLLKKVPATIDKLAVTVTIYDAEARKQNFGQIRNAFIRVVNKKTDREIARFDLSEDMSVETAMIFGEIYRYNGEWKFKAVAQGYAGGLAALCRNYGVEV